MTKHGTKSSQKPEMTKEEFADRYKSGGFTIKKDKEGKRYLERYENTEELLSDLRSVIRGELIRYDKWLARQSWGLGEIPTAEKAADEFLNNNQ
jgi:hypothetical protein